MIDSAQVMATAGSDGLQGEGAQLMSCDTSVDDTAAASERRLAEVARARRFFPGHPSQLRLMRAWLKSLLAPGTIRDDARSIATELAANAIRHTISGHGGHFAVELTTSPGSVRIAVADEGGPTEPQLTRDPEAESGRGLLLVQGLAASVGVVGEKSDRTVWAELREDDLQPRNKPAVISGHDPVRVAGPLIRRRSLYSRPLRSSVLRPPSFSLSSGHGLAVAAVERSLRMPWMPLMVRIR